MTDQEIIAQLQQGKEACLTHVYAHLAMVRSWILKNNGNQEDALDVFQDAVVVFYKNVRSGRYEAKSKISTYLFSICKKQWLNQLNRRLKYERPSDGVVQLAQHTEVPEPEIDNDLPSRATYIQEAMAKLGEPCQSLLIATVFFKQKMIEVAAQFNYASAHSARQQKLRCLKKLGNQLSYDVVLRLR